MSDERLVRGLQARSTRRAAVRLGLQTGIAVAVVVVALVGVALAVVLRSQHASAVDLVTHTVQQDRKSVV